MNEALTTRNYDGTFSHWQGGKVEMLRIIHRVQDGAVAERLVSLDGSGREFVRTGSDLACYLPDKRTVLVERRPAEESLFGGFPAMNEETARFYDVKEVARTRLNRRDTHVIAVSPKDEFRYGYRLWIERTVRRRAERIGSFEAGGARRQGLRRLPRRRGRAAAPQAHATRLALVRAVRGRRRSGFWRASSQGPPASASRDADASPAAVQRARHRA